MSRFIVEEFHPRRIILFGSFARGNPGPESDVDLLVIKDKPVKTRSEMALVRTALQKFRVPIDVLVCSEDYLLKYKDVGGNIIHSIFHEGKELYVQ